MAVSQIDNNGVNLGQLGNRSLIINGAMTIDQRNAGAAVTLTGNQVYIADRWAVYETQSSVLSGQQNQGSVTPPEGFSNYMGYTSLGASTVSAGDIHIFFHNIEGFNFAQANWGSASAKPVTLSFWVRCSLTGSFGGSFINNDQNRAYPFTYTVSSSNTWEYKTITVAGDTTGTWKTDNTRGLNINWSLGTGSNFEGSEGAWVASNKFSATEGTVNLIETSGATWQITGVQLEVGDTATPFEHRSYGDELARCQRYYQRIQASSDTYKHFGLHFCAVDVGGTSYGTAAIPLVTTMRAIPTLVTTGTVSNYAVVAKNTNFTCTALSIDTGIDDGTISGNMYINAYTGSGNTAGAAGALRANNTASAFIAMDAEL